MSARPIRRLPGPLRRAAGLLVVLAAAPAAQAPLDAPELDEARARATWQRLAPPARREVVEWLRLELSHQDTFQLQVLRYGLGLSDRDPGLWPEREDPPAYDARAHAPAQPIPRRTLDPAASRVARARRTFLGERSPRALLRLWTYDWASGELRRERGLDATEVLFENALAGYPPDLDLSCALVERALDDGSERAVLAAFAHAYSDRSGDVVPGVTLYDVWRSGETFETPDVEALGIVHDVLGDWKRWVAPVPGDAQDELYATLGDLFQRARRFRGLRSALADLYAMSAPPNADGYEASRHRLHALWEHALSEPEQLAPLLPRAEGWRAFLEGWDKSCAADEELSAIASSREATLALGEAEVRRTLAWVLRELGARERAGG